MKIEHKIDKNENTVTVEVLLPPNYKGKKIRITTPQVRDYLKSQNIKFTQCTKKDVANNSNGTPEGTWIFKLDNPIQKVVQSNHEKFKSKSKIKKRFDESEIQEK